MARHDWGATVTIAATILLAAIIAILAAIIAVDHDEQSPMPCPTVIAYVDGSPVSVEVRCG